MLYHHLLHGALTGSEQSRVAARSLVDIKRLSEDHSQQIELQLMPSYLVVTYDIFLGIIADIHVPICTDLHIMSVFYDETWSLQQVRL